MSLAVLILSDALRTTQAETTLYVNKFFEVRDYDQPTKYVFSGENRIARVTGSLSTNTRIQRLRVYPGWNLCSLAVTATNALEQITSAFSLQPSAFHWQPGTFTWIELAAGTTLPAGTVLWLHASTNSTLALTGAYCDPTNRSMAVGGSFEPAAGLEIWDLPSTFNFPPSTALWHYDAADQSWQMQAAALRDSDPGFPRFLAPGEAIFLDTDIPSAVEVPDSALRVRYYHQDHLGSSSVMTDAGGVLVEETAFYPFGIQRHEHRPRQIEEDYKFTQKERDRESGLHYFEARYLASFLSRFTTPDPKYANPDSVSRDDLAVYLAEPQSLNLYSYVRSNPLHKIDPTGLDATRPQQAEPGSTLSLGGIGDVAIESVQVPRDIPAQETKPLPENVAGPLELKKSERSVDFVVTRMSDESSASLYKAFASGPGFFKDAEITIRTKGGDAFAKFKLAEVRISGITSWRHPDAAREMDSITLTATGVQTEYLGATQQKQEAPSMQESSFHAHPRSRSRAVTDYVRGSSTSGASTRWKSARGRAPR